MPRNVVAASIQDRLWYLAELMPESPAYNLCDAYRLRGEINVTALRTAWSAVIRRHEILRTALAYVDGRVVQRIAGPEELAPSFAVLDLRSRTDGRLTTDRESSAGQLCAQLAADPMDLTEGWPARLTLARLGDADYLAVLVLHRAVADRRSMSLLASELSEHYAAACGGRTEWTAPPAHPQFADYAKWQRTQLSTPRYARLLGWWTSALTSIPPALSLPADRARPAGPSYRGGVVEFDWGADSARQLAGFCQERGQTRFSVLLAAFQCVLHRYSRERRIPVAAPVTVRPRRYKRLLGPFENTLVLCGDFDGRPTFAELVTRVGRTVSDALEHRELPFEQLVRALNPARDPRRTPLYDAFFEFAEEAEEAAGPERAEAESRLAGGELLRRQVFTGAVDADLTLAIDRVTPTIAGSLRFRSSLFEEASARRVLEQVHVLLASALREPGLPVDALPMDSPEQTRTAVRAADRIAGASPASHPVPDLVQARALDQPTVTALAWGAETVTYQQFIGQAAAISTALTAGGGVAGRPVAVRVSAEPRRAAAILGVLSAGARLVSLGSGDLGERGMTVLGEMRPVCLVLDHAAAEDPIAQWYTRELPGRILDLRRLDYPEDAKEDSPGSLPLGQATLDAIAYVTYTSGSTGKPKGIIQSHRNLAQFVTWLAAECRLGPGARVAQWAAAGYDASLCEIFAALVAGAALCPVPEKIRANPDKMVDWLITQQVTVFQTVPSFARELLGAITRRGAVGQLSALDHLLLAGEPLPGAVADGLRAALPRVRLINLYGATETILATCYEVDGPVSGTVPIGRPIPGRQVLVLDESDRPCPAGVPGQIVVRSPYIALGYVGATPRPRSAFREITGLGEHGCYLTGDLGRWRWDGELEFCGRQDEQVKFHGIRLELSDIETAIAADAAVAECAVVAVLDRDRAVARLVAYVVPPDEPAGPLPDAARWRANLRRQFGDAMPPVSFKTLPALPRNLGGKVDRRMLPAAEHVANAAARLPESRVAQEVAALWMQVLGIEHAHMDDSFFAVGGHSLLLLLLASRVRERFGIDIQLWEFCGNPTLARLVELAESLETNSQLYLTH